jgi:hypothetical protein
MSPANALALAQNYVDQTLALIFHNSSSVFEAIANNLTLLAAGSTCSNVTSALTSVVVSYAIEEAINAFTLRYDAAIAAQALTEANNDVSGAIGPFDNYGPITGSMASHFAIFWAPVLIGWVVLYGTCRAQELLSDSAACVHYG